MVVDNSCLLIGFSGIKSISQQIHSTGIGLAKTCAEFKGLVSNLVIKEHGAQKGLA
jgi:hypothetical protein